MGHSAAGDRTAATLGFLGRAWLIVMHVLDVLIKLFEVLKGCSQGTGSAARCADTCVPRAFLLVCAGSPARLGPRVPQLAEKVRLVHAVNYDRLDLTRWIITEWRWVFDGKSRQLILSLLFGLAFRSVTSVGRLNSGWPVRSSL